MICQFKKSNGIEWNRSRLICRIENFKSVKLKLDFNFRTFSGSKKKPFWKIVKMMSCRTKVESDLI